MIPYEDLVAALASWRTRNGLPVGHSDYLGEPPAMEPMSFEAYQEAPPDDDEVVDLSDESLEDAVLEEASAPDADGAPYPADAGELGAEASQDDVRADTDDATLLPEETFAAGEASLEGAEGDIALPEELYGEVAGEAGAVPAPAAEDPIYGDTSEGDAAVAPEDAPPPRSGGEGFPLGGDDETDIANAIDFAFPEEQPGEGAPVPEGTSQMWPPSAGDGPEEAPLAEPPGDGEPGNDDPDWEPPPQ